MDADLKGEAVETEAPPIGERLKRIFSPASRKDIARQIERQAAPALVEVRDALSNEGVDHSRVEAD